MNECRNSKTVLQILFIRIFIFSFDLAFYGLHEVLLSKPKHTIILLDRIGSWYQGSAEMEHLLVFRNEVAGYSQ